MPKKSSIGLAHKGVLTLILIVERRASIYDKGLVDLFDGLLRCEDEALKSAFDILREEEFVDESNRLTNKGLYKATALTRFGDDPRFMNERMLFTALPRMGERLEEMAKKEPQKLNMYEAELESFVNSINRVIEIAYSKEEPKEEKK